jgi:hypothetical protein
MRRLAVAFACAFAFAVGALPAAADQPLPPVEQKQRLEDLKDLPAPGADLNTLPPENQESAVVPNAVFRRGCIFFPGQRASFIVTIPPRRVTRYAVTPDNFFDVVLTIRSVGRVFRADRFFRGGTEVINLFNPNFFRISTRVTISGFPGRFSTGCFFFSATP